MELRHLRYFVAVAEELHFGKAAKRLFMAQPPLSQQIMRLEDDLGVKLFHRTKRRVELTQAGIAFLEEVRQILSLTEKAVQTAKRAERGEAGHLAIGFVGSATYLALPKVLWHFRSIFPQVNFSLREMTTAEQVIAIRSRTLDVGFVRPPIYDPQLLTSIIVEEEFVLAVPETHRVAQAESVQFSDLVDESFILYSRHLGPGLYDPVVGACHQAGFSPKVVQEANQMHTILGLVLAGFGIAFVPECVRALRQEGVTYKRFASGAPQTTIALAWNRDNRSNTLVSLLSQVNSLGDLSNADWS